MTGTGKGPLRIAIEDFITTFDIFAPVKLLIGRLLEWLEDENIKLYRAALASQGLTDLVPDAYHPDNIARLTKLAPAGWFLSVLSFAGVFLGGFMGISAPAHRASMYAADMAAHTYRPSPAELWAMWRRYPDAEIKVDKWMSEQGLTPAMVEGYKKLTEYLLQPGQLEILRLKGLLSESDYQAELSAQGVTLERVQQIQDLYKVIPGVQDLISMAVREAWNEDVVSRFQYDADYPAELAEWAGKQGLSPDWSKRYWRAHWQIPGVQSGYEMLHRLRPGKTNNPFTVDDLKLLLQTADIPVFFRDRLIEISYSPYTRVDIRRMYSTNVLSETEVYDAYRDIGYDDDHARKLTEFTTHIEAAEDKGVTKDAIISSYTLGIIDRSTSHGMLKEIGYNDNDSQFLTGIVDAKQEQQMIDDQLKVIQAKFVGFQVDEAEVMSLIGTLDMPTERVNTLLALWNVQRLNKTAIPSKADMESFYRAGTISGDQILEYMHHDGYTNDDSSRYLLRMDTEIQADALKERDRAQATADRLAAAKTKTRQQTDKADLDVQIAEAQLSIAECKLAAHDPEITPDQKTQLTEAIAGLQYEIAQYRLKKAQISAGITPTG
jgi:hypothetical protein